MAGWGGWMGERKECGIDHHRGRDKPIEIEPEGRKEGGISSDALGDLSLRIPREGPRFTKGHSRDHIISSGQEAIGIWPVGTTAAG